MRLLSPVLACAILSFGCTADFAQQGDADVILRIQKIIAESGHDSEEGDFLLSDVTPVFNDNAIITFEVIPKNPNLPDPGSFNDVFLERYEVRYIRTDGRNTEGVDVPFRFTGGMATLVPAAGTAEAAVIVVRHQAKEEPPLRNLAFLPQAGVGTGVGGGQGIISVVAELTFHGRTTSGKAVTATGRLSISFADYANDTQQQSPTPNPSFAPPTAPTPAPASPTPSPTPTPRTSPTPSPSPR